jgi:hypothetical protein
LETVVESTLDQRPISRFSEKLMTIAASPGGRLWAGAVGSYFWLIQLEGVP